MLRANFNTIEPGGVCPNDSKKRKTGVEVNGKSNLELDLQADSVTDGKKGSYPMWQQKIWVSQLLSSAFGHHAVVG